MNLDNVVLVRAMNNLPLDGVLVPSCEGKYLKYQLTDDYYYIIKRKVQADLESKLGRYLEVWNEEDKKILDDVLKEYLPLTSSYTSTLSFSLNGLVPDDMNNKFSDLKLAVLDPIKNHQHENFVNIDVIDTTIKGSLVVSNEAILLIEKDYFLSLRDEEKMNLVSHYKLELFTGTLKDAIAKILQKYNYPAIPLIQQKELNDMEDCIEKESMISFQNDFARTHNVSRLKLQQLYMYPISSMSEVDVEASEKVKSDFDKNLIVEKYYKDNFSQFLVSKGEMLGIQLIDEEKFYLFSDFSNREEVLEKLVDSIIQIIGLEEFKQIINEYNQIIYNNYITNDEIVSLNSESR